MLDRVLAIFGRSGGLDISTVSSYGSCKHVMPPLPLVPLGRENSLSNLSLSVPLTFGITAEVRQ